MSRYSEQEQIRRDKLSELQKLGITPYPASSFPVDFFADQIETKYGTDKSVVIAGRLMSRRIQGKASFAELMDSTGKIQVYFNRDEICPGQDKKMYNQVYKRLLDIGDIIGIKGTLFTTGVGVKTVMVKSFTLLSKSLRPLPLPKKDADGKIHDSFKDPELRYRQRYVDLIVNPEVKEIFKTRTKITSLIRNFFDQMGYQEVETPILQSIPGGANARPFITHHNALNVPMYLRIANELFLKRLIVGGFEGVYEFAKVFRNEGMDKTHNPEFTGFELYVAYKDYLWMMDTTQELMEYLTNSLFDKTKILIGNQEIDFKAPYRRIPLLGSIEEHTGIDISGMDEQELKKVAADLGVETNEQVGEAKLIDTIFSTFCQKHYQSPTFITDYPKSMSPLTKEHRSNPELTERFELFVAGSEIANAYSELNNPIEQYNRFKDQAILSAKGDDEAMLLDRDFVRSLEYGMPPTSGIGIGIDRLVMLLTDKSSIQEVLFFPQMRPE
ncbi:MAG: lysine--tRNA ligase [Flavobacteriaceae bacterium]|nr:lysine--tRNA ligase [Flavobacteriaceae bacterium]